MPPELNIDTLNDAALPDGMESLSGGVNSYARRNRLKPDQAHRLINVSLSREGVPQTRRGSSLVGDDTAGAHPIMGMGYLDTLTGTELLLRVKNGACEKHDGTLANAWSAASGFTPNASARVCMAQGLGVLYLSNGVDNMRTWNGSSFTDLGNGSTDAPKAKFILWQGSRLIAAGIDGAPDTVAFSDILDTSSTHWPANSRLRVGAGDGDPITGISKWTKHLVLVFKRSSIWVINANPATAVASMEIDLIHGSIGCVSHYSIAQVGTDVWFLSSDGVRSVRRVLEGEDREVSLPISWNLHNLIQKLNTAAAANACGGFFENKYFLAFPTGSATWPDTLIVYNTVFGAWEGYWTGLLPTVFVRSYFDGLDRWQWGQSDGRVLQWRHYTPDEDEADEDYEDAGEEIATTIDLRGFTFGQAFNEKQGLAAEFEFDRCRAKSVTINLLLDDDPGEIELLQTGNLLGGPTFPIVFPHTFPALGFILLPLTLLHQRPFREMAIQITSPNQKLAVRSVRLSAYLNTMPISK